jgi:heme-degrading monooxygenase HmoA
VGTAEPFVALVIYPTTADKQAHQADMFVSVSAEPLRASPGFLRGSVFLSEDGAGVVTLTEWRDREAFAQYRQTESGRAAVVLAADLHPHPYWLRHHAEIEAASRP